MNAKEKREKVAEHLQIWMGKLGLHDWGIELVFHKESCQVQTNIPYKQATIYFNTDIDEDELEEYALHELLHIRLSGYRWFIKKLLNRITPNEADIFNDIDEGVTDTLTRVLLREV